MTDDTTSSPPLEWRSERAQLLVTIAQQQQDAARLTKRFKLLQRALKDQQVVLDRYQRALLQSGLPLPAPSTNHSDAHVAHVTKQPHVDGAAYKTGHSADRPSNTEAHCVVAQCASASISSGSSSSNSVTTTSAVPSTARMSAPRSPLLTADLQQHTQASSDDPVYNSSYTTQQSRRNDAHARSASLTREHDDVSNDVHSIRDTDVQRMDALASASNSNTLTQLPAPSIQLTPAAAVDDSDSDSPDNDSSKLQAANDAGDNASWIVRKADFHHNTVAVVAPPPPSSAAARTENAESSSSNQMTSTTDDTHSTSTSRYSGLKRKALTDRTAPSATWAEEKRRMQQAGLLPGRQRFTDTNRPPRVPNDNAAADKPTTATFEYVEVVRNRDARAALQGHDCIECRKYYDALVGVLSPEALAHAKTTCSRHRARFEPYNTPDDFWRLSFPDSASQVSDSEI